MKFFTISFLLALIALCAVLYFLPGKITSAVHTTSSEGYGVAATTYPIWVLTREVADGTGIEVELLTPPDAGCPHDYVLTPNDLMKVWGIETEELHELAVRNMTRLIPGTFRGMSVVMNALCGGKTDVLDPENEMLFVLSNEGGWYGAAAVLDDKIMKSVVERVGEEFYVLPSSVHELLVVPLNMGMDVGQLKEMVTSINASEVALEEQLSDNVYRYSTEKGLQVAR